MIRRRSYAVLESSDETNVTLKLCCQPLFKQILHQTVFPILKMFRQEPVNWRKISRSTLFPFAVSILTEF